MADTTLSPFRRLVSGLTALRQARAAKEHVGQRDPPHRSFALVLSGGGARGIAHAGVLHALEHDGLQPSAIVGVSMGAIVGATYALNPNWYADLISLDLAALPGITRAEGGTPRARFRALLASERAVRNMLLGQGAWAGAEAPIRGLFDGLALGKDLEESRIPFVAIATDLRSGRRVILDRGRAADAMYASAALAGVLPPQPQGDALLADGGYADMAPVDVARQLGAEIVLAVDASPDLEAPEPRNGFQVFLRAMAVTHQQHAHRRFEEADVVIRPRFAVPIDTLDFRHMRHCVTAGIRAVRSAREELAALLQPGAKPRSASPASRRPGSDPLGRPLGAGSDAGREAAQLTPPRTPQ